MGAWSYKVITNDTALDAIEYLCNSKCVEEDICNFLRKGNDIDVMLLAVELVDISFNGIDEDILGEIHRNRNLFESIEKNPMIYLREYAIGTIKFIIDSEEKNNEWVEKVKEDRKNLLLKIENRLKNG